MSSETIDRMPSVMDNPDVIPIARTYAIAFLDAAKTAGASEADAAGELRGLVVDGFRELPELREILCSNILSTERVLEFIDQSLANRLSPLVANFLKVLARHDRLPLLPAIEDQVERVWETRTGRKRVQVSTAVALSDELAAGLRQEIQDKFGFDPIVEAVVDPALLGGLTLRIGDTVYDGSLKSRVQQLHTRLRERCLHEIQRGRDRFSSPEGN
jgi:F-type H+-transporting ATPase subunit delta